MAGFPRTAPIVRFMRFVEVDERGCWLWQGSRTHGYGYFWDGDQGIRAHIWMFKHLFGEHGYEALDHLCRVRACVNPKHLEPVSHQTNLLRSPLTIAAINAAKTHCLRGHEFTPENTYEPPRRPGRRYCKQCTQMRVRAARAA